MTERPHSRYTRAKTWAALYGQHLHAGYAVVPYSATNNSIAVISCLDPHHAEQDLVKETQDLANLLLKHAGECAAYYSSERTQEQTPALLARARQAVVLAKSSDYYHYHLEDHIEFKLVICGLHDSYLHLPVWEMRSNRRYQPRETAITITSPDFERLRCMPFGHNILIGALVGGNQEAMAFRDTLPPRTRRRIMQEVETLQHKRYRGRPLAFLTEAERREIGSKISEGLLRYHDQKRLQAV
jgi:hypothetical protein